MKARTITAVGLVIVLVAGSLALILGIPAGLLVGAISNRLEAAVGYRLDVPGGTTLTFWPQLTFVARDVRVSRPGDTGSIDRFTAQSLRLSLKAVSVFSGRPHITEIALVHPVLRQELQREHAARPAGRPPAGSGASAAGTAALPIIDRIVVTDGTVVLTNPSNGVESRIQMALSTTGFYGGHAEGRLELDASRALATSSAHIDLNGVRALPLLLDVADFRALDGRMRAAIDLRATGASERAAISTLNMSIDFVVEDGDVRGINIAKMVRTLMAMTLSGWQEAPTEKTDFTQLTALFRIKDGQASTQDLQLAGPLVRVSGTGSADLINRTLQFRLDPKLVMSLQGQGGGTDMAGLGVPVMIQGAWSDPHIYPDIAGILENPDAAYARLRALGQGLLSQEHGSTVDAIRPGLGTHPDASKSDRRDGRTSPSASKHSGGKDPEDLGWEILHNFLGR